MMGRMLVWLGVVVLVVHAPLVRGSPAPESFVRGNATRVNDAVLGDLVSSPSVSSSSSSRMEFDRRQCEFRHVKVPGWCDCLRTTRGEWLDVQYECKASILDVQDVDGRIVCSRRALEAAPVQPNYPWCNVAFRKYSSGWYRDNVEGYDYDYYGGTIPQWRHNFPFLRDVKTQTCEDDVIRTAIAKGLCDNTKIEYTPPYSDGDRSSPSYRNFRLYSQQFKFWLSHGYNYSGTYIAPRPGPRTRVARQFCAILYPNNPQACCDYRNGRGEVNEFLFYTLCVVDADGGRTYDLGAANWKAVSSGDDFFECYRLSDYVSGGHFCFALRYAYRSLGSESGSVRRFTSETEVTDEIAQEMCYNQIPYDGYWQQKNYRDRDFTVSFEWPSYGVPLTKDQCCEVMAASKYLQMERLPPMCGDSGPVPTEVPVSSGCLNPINTENSNFELGADNSLTLPLCESCRYSDADGADTGVLGRGEFNICECMSECDGGGGGPSPTETTKPTPSTEPTPTATQKPPPTGGCVDIHEDCEWVITEQSCKRDWVKVKCALSCGECTPECVDTSADCERIIADNTCKKDWVQRKCAQSCGTCGALVTPTPSPSATPVVECEDVDGEDCERLIATHSCKPWVKSRCEKSCGMCPEPCEDINENCERVIAANTCNKSWVQTQCQKSCGLCPAAACKDVVRNCESIIERNGCDPPWVIRKCPLSCDKCDCKDESDNCDNIIEKNSCKPVWVRTKCMLSCRQCDLTHER